MNIYEGEIKKGLRDGEGILFCKSGKVLFKGHFKEGNKHGIGTYYRVNGSIKK
jgi:antitoxin component YwqK of YwqJK toxin-antitoxin module